MFFIVMAERFDAVELEQAAACCDSGSQPAARAWVRSLESIADGALICVGKEGNEILAFSAGVFGRNARERFVLNELCVSPRRAQCGIGAELLAFTLHQAQTRGAVLAVASPRLEERGAPFLVKHGFGRGDAGGAMRKTIGPPR